MPVKAKRKRTPPAPPPTDSEAPAVEGKVGGVKPDRSSPPSSVSLPAGPSWSAEQPAEASMSSAAGLSSGVRQEQERPAFVQDPPSREHLSGQWGLAPPTMDDYMRRAQQPANGAGQPEPYNHGQQQMAGPPSGHPSYARYAPPPHPPPPPSGQHGAPTSPLDGPPAYSTGLAPPVRYEGHAQTSPSVQPQHLQPYPHPTPSPQLSFATYAPANGAGAGGPAPPPSNLHDASGQLTHSPFAPQPQTLQLSQLAPLADFQRPLSTFQTPSHVDLPVPVLPQVRPHPEQVPPEQQPPNGTAAVPRAVNLTTPSRPPFYAPPNGDVTYFEHPYAPPKETNHRILDHLIERVVEHGFCLPDTAGSALRARPDGSGSYVAAGEPEEDSGQTHAEGRGRELVRSQSPGSNRLVLNDLLLPPKDLADGAFAAAQG